MPSKIELIIIIPCYNEEDRLDIEQYARFIDNNANVSILFINDGSRDKTENKIKLISENRSRVGHLNLKNNLGKAEAIRQGFHCIFNKLKKSELTEEGFQYPLIGFFDSDLATPLDELNRFLSIFRDSPQFKMLIGSRVASLGANIQRNLFRYLMGRTLNITVRLIFKISVYDTQCGCKVFDYRLAEDIFKKPFVSRWLMDIELIMRFKKYCKVKNQGALPLLEVSLMKWTEIKNSKIKIIDYLLIPYYLIVIYLHYCRPVKIK